MALKRITDLTELASLSLTDEIEVSGLSTTITITAATIDAAAGDNSYNDTGNGFLTAGFAVGDRITVSGFTNAANNQFVATITSVTAGKIITDATGLVTEAVGPTVTITKRISGRVTGSDFVELVALDSRFGREVTILADLTASGDVTDAMLVGDIYQPVNSATAVTITVPPSLTNLQPCTFEATGVGVVTFAAGIGVTINSAGGLLGISGQFAAVTLIPKGSDVYSLVGSLA